jgi:hypothetical protein
MEKSYEDHPHFSMRGRGQDTVIVTDLIDKDQCQISKGIPHMANRGLHMVEETIGLHKIIHNRLMIHQDKGKTEVIHQLMLLEEGMHISQVEIQCLHISAITTNRCKGMVHKEIRVYMLLLVRGNIGVSGRE